MKKLIILSVVIISIFLFTAQTGHASTYPGDSYNSLLDWSWMQRNAGCLLAS